MLQEIKFLLTKIKQIQISTLEKLEIILQCD